MFCERMFRIKSLEQSLSLMTAGAETTEGWQMLLNDLAARKMGRPRLVISDGNPGIDAARDRLWAGVPHQLRNRSRKRRSMRTKRCAKTTTRPRKHGLAARESLPSRIYSHRLPQDEEVKECSNLENVFSYPNAFRSPNLRPSNLYLTELKGLIVDSGIYCPLKDG
jgi:hypothetical protein